MVLLVEYRSSMDYYLSVGSSMAMDCYGYAGFDTMTTERERICLLLLWLWNEVDDGALSRCVLWLLLLPLSACRGGLCMAIIFFSSFLVSNASGWEKRKEAF